MHDTNERSEVSISGRQKESSWKTSTKEKSDGKKI